jgi:hypothetical protein
MGEADHEIEVDFATLFHQIFLLQHVLRAFCLEGQHFSDPLLLATIEKDVLFDVLEIFLTDGSYLFSNAS